MAALILGALQPDLLSLCTHLKVLRMGLRRGWILRLSTPFSQLPIMLPVVGPFWRPFHLSIEATTSPLEG